METMANSTDSTGREKDYKEYKVYIREALDSHTDILTEHRTIKKFTREIVDAGGVPFSKATSV